MDILPQRSARYVSLWAKKRIAAGSLIHHADTPIMRELAVSFEVQRFNETDELANPAIHPHVHVKKALRRFHLRVPYDRLPLYLKEREFLSFHPNLSFPELVQIVFFGREHSQANQIGAM